jgi:hypothetical protein
MPKSPSVVAAQWLTGRQAVAQLGKEAQQSQKKAWKKDCVRQSVSPWNED